MSAPDLYVVHYRLDDLKGTPGQCRTDHKLEKGDVLYTRDGRATVRSCRWVRAVAALRTANQGQWHTT